MEDTNFITIQGFMRTKLGLNGNDLLVYAIIYGFSQNGQGKFTGSAQYLADWCGSTKRGVYKNLNNLVEKGFIVKEEHEQNGIKYCDYSVSEFTGDELSSVGGSELSSPHNIYNNIKENNNNTNVLLLKEKECVQKKFVPPSLDEVKAYVEQKGYSMSADDFYYHYESVNWYRGKTRIVNWKNAVTQWEKHNNKQSRPFDGLKVATEENFITTIKLYPKHVTELNNARVSWANAIRKYGDAKETLKDIAGAIIIYKNDCRTKEIDERYIKSFSSFMNDSLEYNIVKAREIANVRKKN